MIRTHAIWISISALLTLQSCLNDPKPVFTESIPQQTRTHVQEKKELEKADYDFRNIDLLGKTAALFVTNRAVNAPESVIEQANKMLTSALRDAGLYQELIPPQEVLRRLQTDTRLNQLKNIYLDSLTTISISDKDISVPLAKFLNVDNFIILQVENWPCDDCFSKKRLRFKLRVVNAVTSDIVWTGINELNTLDKNSNDLNQFADILLNELFNSFNLRFRLKWHQRRFEHLTKLSNT